MRGLCRVGLAMAGCLFSAASVLHAQAPEPGLPFSPDPVGIPTNQSLAPALPPAGSNPYGGAAITPEANVALYGSQPIRWAPGYGTFDEGANPFGQVVVQQTGPNTVRPGTSGRFPFFASRWTNGAAPTAAPALAGGAAASPAPATPTGFSPAAITPNGTPTPTMSGPIGPAAAPNGTTCADGSCTSCGRHGGIFGRLLGHHLFGPASAEITSEVPAESTQAPPGYGSQSPPGYVPQAAPGYLPAPAAGGAGPSPYINPVRSPRDFFFFATDP